MWMKELDKDNVLHHPNIFLVMNDPQWITEINIFQESPGMLKKWCFINNNWMKMKVLSSKRSQKMN